MAGRPGPPPWAKPPSSRRLEAPSRTAGPRYRAVPVSGLSLAEPPGERRAGESPSAPGLLRARGSPPLPKRLPPTGDSPPRASSPPKPRRASTGDGPEREAAPGKPLRTRQRCGGGRGRPGSGGGDAAPSPGAGSEVGESIPCGTRCRLTPRLGGEIKNIFKCILKKKYNNIIIIINRTSWEKSTWRRFPGAGRCLAPTPFPGSNPLGRGRTGNRRARGPADRVSLPRPPALLRLRSR